MIRSSTFLGRSLLSPTLAEVSSHNGQVINSKSQAPCAVTGGLGGLGILAANELAVAGAVAVIPISRRVHMASIHASLAKILGCQHQAAILVTVRCDVSDGSAVFDVLSARAASRLGSVVHAAGTLQDGLLISSRGGLKRRL